MANDPKAGFTALNRFGFGARGDGDLAAAAADPRAFLEAELGQPGIALLDGPGLGRTPDLLKSQFDEQEQRRLEREGADRAKVASALQMVQGAEPSAQQVAMAGQTAPQAQPPKQPPSVEQIAFRAEALARVQRAAWPAPASSNGSSRSGPTISACRRPRAASSGSSPARTSARRSARTCSDASPTC